MIDFAEMTEWVEDYVQNGDYADSYHPLLTEDRACIAELPEFQAVPKCIRKQVIDDCIDLAEMSVASWGVAPGKIVLGGWEIGEYESEVEIESEDDRADVRAAMANGYCITWDESRNYCYLYTYFGQDCVIGTITPEQLREVIVENTIAYCQRVDQGSYDLSVSFTDNPTPFVVIQDKSELLRQIQNHFEACPDWINLRSIVNDRLFCLLHRGEVNGKYLLVDLTWSQHKVELSS